MTSIVSMDFDPAKLTLHWDDNSSSQFHSIWLRDNVLEPDARHANGQRLFDWSELPKDTSMKSVKMNGDQLEIEFKADDRISNYPINWLKSHSYDQTPHQPPYKLWDKTIDLKSVTHDYRDVEKQGQAMCDWLNSVRVYGFGIIQNVPCEEGTILDVINSFGFVRETNYGKLFEVRTEKKPNNLAFTPLGLNVHTDNPYRTPVPGLQALHCLDAEEGGASLFVDGFMVADLLRQENPKAFKLLSQYQSNFRFCDEGTDLRNREAVIGVDDQGIFKNIRYNNRSAAPLNLPVDIMEDYYAALLTYSNMLHWEQVELNFKLAPGELVLFDNERILHGRKAFAGGKRHLQGSYADKDSMNSWIHVFESNNS